MYWFKHLGAILINVCCSVSKLCLTLLDPHGHWWPTIKKVLILEFPWHVTEGIKSPRERENTKFM